MVAAIMASLCSPKSARADAGNEVLYRFEFPERPGALLDFLKKIGSDWNISLFHYPQTHYVCSYSYYIPTSKLTTLNTADIVNLQAD
jgi:hypothetical protein